MRTLTLLCALCLTFGMAANAQTAADKALDGIYKAERAQNAAEKLKGIFGKKKTKTEVAQTTPAPVAEIKPQVPAGSRISVISVSGIEFAKLKVFNENILACQGVQFTSFKYGSPVSTINVTHTGTTEALLKLMGETSKDIFTDSNIQSFEEGAIALKL